MIPNPPVSNEAQPIQKNLLVIEGMSDDLQSISTSDTKSSSLPSNSNGSLSNFKPILGPQPLLGPQPILAPQSIPILNAQPILNSQPIIHPQFYQGAQQILIQSGVPQNKLPQNFQNTNQIQILNPINAQPNQNYQKPSQCLFNDNHPMLFEKFNFQSWIPQQQNQIVFCVCQFFDKYS